MNNGYNVLEIKSRLIREFEKRGVKPYKILPEIGLSKNTLDSANKSMPKADTLAKIADYFGCSVDYLLGRADSPTGTYSINGNNNVQAINGNNSQLTVGSAEQDETTAEIVKLVKNLPLVKRAEAILYLNDLKTKTSPLSDEEKKG